MARDPLLILRVPPALKSQINADAEQQGTTVSEAVRSVLLAAFAPPTQRTSRPAKPREAPARAATTSTCEHRVRRGSFCKKCSRIIL